MHIEEAERMQPCLKFDAAADFFAFSVAVVRVNYRSVVNTQKSAGVRPEMEDIFAVFGNP